VQGAAPPSALRAARLRRYRASPGRQFALIGLDVGTLLRTIDSTEHSVAYRRQSCGLCAFGAAGLLGSAETPFEPSGLVRPTGAAGLTLGREFRSEVCSR